MRICDCGSALVPIRERPSEPRDGISASRDRIRSRGPFRFHLGAGLVAAGFIPDRPGDEIGIAVAAARNGSHYANLQAQQAAPVNGAEIALELASLAQVADWLAIEPDAQYVIYPNTDLLLANTVVPQLQVELSF